MLKVYLKYMLFLLGLRTTIPAKLINQKSVKESGERLVDLRACPNIFFDISLKNKPVLVREAIAQKLQHAKKLLPNHMHLKILSAYRSVQEQTQLYQAHYLKVQQMYPALTPQHWERMTQAVYAKPKAGGGGHQTGGAIDITLCDECGQDFDMGTRYLEMGQKTPMGARDLSVIAKANRVLLQRVLTAVDMQNYPNEWWHFCYGDKMWAAYRHKKYAIYGPIYIDE